jgi:probable F420-dependent oxidoreductase
MKFGVALINRGPMAGPENLTRAAQRAEALGFDSLAVSDHIIIPRKVTTNYPYHPEGLLEWTAARNYYDPIATLGVLAGKTERIRLGVSVLVVPYRNPVSTAKMLATIDALSGGRVFMGIGTGWWEDEFRALGYKDHFADRGPRTDEYLRIWRNLWTEDDPQFEGKFFQYADVEFSPKPVQAGGIPIWVGGHTGRALKRTVALGDAWHPIGQRPPAHLPPDELGAKAARLSALAEEAGRDPASIPIMFRAPVGFDEKSEALLNGSPAKICDDLRAYEKQGVSHLTVDLPGASFDEVMDNMERVAADVMPNFR